MERIKKWLRAALLWLLALVDKKKPEGRKHLYTDKKGNRYFSVDFKKLHGSRRVAITAILEQMQRGIDNETLNMLLAEINSFAKVGDFTKVVYTSANIMARSSNVASLNLLFQAALILVFAENEPDEYSKTAAEQKSKAWGIDEDARFFFMDFVLKELELSASSSAESLKRLAVQENLQTDPKSIQTNMWRIFTAMQTQK